MSENPVPAPEEAAGFGEQLSGMLNILIDPAAADARISTSALPTAGGDGRLRGTWGRPSIRRKGRCRRIYRRIIDTCSLPATRPLTLTSTGSARRPSCLTPTARPRIGTTDDVVARPQ